jgi:hypothetical protein
MGMRRSGGRGLAALAMVFAGCTSLAIPQPSCTPGAQTACACVGGAQGAQVCGLDRVLGVCACPDGSAPIDAPTADSPTADMPSVDLGVTDVPRADAPDASVADVAVTDAGGPADVGPADTGVDVPRCGTGDLDSDDDGLTDPEERAAMTDPCAADSDGDGVSDLIEVAARSDPRAAGSVPPAGDLYVALPYRAPGTTARESRELAFSTRIRAIDLFFLVDNSASMQPVIAALRSNLNTIITGVQRVVPDVRVGVGSFDSMPFLPSGQSGSPGDYTLWMRQALSTDVAASQRAFDAMRTIDDETGMRFFGGDNPEDQTEAIYEVIAGGGSRGHEADAAALRSVRNARDAAGNGWVPQVDPARDCGATAAQPRYGWGCFAEGRVPVVVLASDAPWYDGCIADDAARYRSTQGHTCDETAAALNARGGFFVGVDVGTGVGGFTYLNAQSLAMRTRTTDASGAPVVLGPGRSNVAMTASQVLDGVTRLASGSRQDITARTAGDPASVGLPAGRTTADFVRAVVPVRGVPEAPMGYDRRDATTFYGTSPSTQAVFRVEMLNDLVEGGDALRVFRATVQATGRGATVVDSRVVFVVVPARGHGLPVTP